MDNRRSKVLESAAVKDPILDDLNEAQREAVTHEGGPLLVVAGAGTGKTRVVTRRVARVIRSGADPREVLAITFTNKAAGEMRDRIQDLVGESRAWVSTFHSTCARILRRDGPRIDLPRNFTIYDEDDALRCVKEALRDLGLETKASHVRARISELKSQLVQPDDFRPSGMHERALEDVYGAYQEILRARSALDFDDLLAEAVRLFREDEDALARYRERFRHVLVDEYQDTNRAQYALIKLLAPEGWDLCATGDPDQSIYSWRGADIRNILEFERDYPGCTVVRLEENYRSTNAILRHASALIAFNSERIERGLWSKKGDGEDARFIAAGDGNGEALEVAAEVLRLRARGRRLGEMAVFFRTNAQSREFETVCLEADIPYVVVGGISFFRRKEVKDLLAYLRVVANPSDDVAFSRIVNVPTRGVGTKTLARLTSFAREAGRSMRERMSEFVSGAKIQRRAREGLVALGDVFDAVAGDRASIRAALDKTLRLTGYREALDQDGMEIVDELLVSADEFEGESGGGLDAFLESFALASGVDGWDKRAERLVLMTLHSAKGLEFPVVFLTGLEEGLLPHARSLDAGPSAVEEERRLAYVGMTRAKEVLYLTHARQRRRTAGIRSRFVGEAGVGLEAPVAEAVERHVEPDVEYAEMELWRGMRVRHPHFGEGTVVSAYGSGERARVVVDFDVHGRKRLILADAGLEPA